MAGLPNGQRPDHQHHQPQRPSLNAHHSNSVPSTPLQKPRQFSRRYSRSPSPNRALNSQSPRSVVSEAVAGANGSRSAAGAVCKFETGAEIRRRRIPYLDTYLNDVAPPKKEPRKTLEPHEQDRLSGDMRELYDRLLPSEESEERRAQLVAKLDRILNEEWPGNNIKVAVFGSSGNLLSSTESDVDICITTPVKNLVSMHALAALLAKHGMEKVVCRAAAKVPIVKCWDPELQLASDLNVNNPLALQNTRLIKTYVQIDDRVRPLAKIIKHWTKQRVLNDAAYGATISSYTWICMIISFLQRRKPPILPSLQLMHGPRPPHPPDEQDVYFEEVLDKLKGYGDANKESLGELLFQFFRHYGYEFQYAKYVVSVREGKLLSRKEKRWGPGDGAHSKHANDKLCVEEPFTVDRNLGNTADHYAWHGIHLEIRRAFELLDDGLQLDKCCEQYEFPQEEKPLFQKPPPKPKPTLTRSASQSGQNNHDRESVSGRSGKPRNRNQSSQRAGNRRASSGATFSNQRMPFSPPIGSTSTDYFQLKGSLHEQLYQQYQYLQQQQDVLRSQLASQQQAQAQARVGDLAGAGSPRPRLMEHPPPTAPLLNGHLYHYSAAPRYPPPSPMSQARSREGTNTNPSSPSLVAAVPALRRQVQRASVADGAANSARSQSQPGRSLPHPLALQQQAHPGLEMALGSHMQNPRSVSHPYHPAQHAMHFPYSPYPQMHTVAQPSDTHMPKEYVGYYLNQSPQLGPQYGVAGPQMAPATMTLRDPPARQRRVTPELMLPTLNGRHSSRSPSPLGHMRSYPTNVDRRASQPAIVQSPSTYEPKTPMLPAQPQPPAPAETDIGGPVIVNGSNRSNIAKPAERVNGLPSKFQTARTEAVPPLPSDEGLRARPLSLRTRSVRPPEHSEYSARRPSSPNLSPTSKSKSDRRFTPTSPPNGTMNHMNGSQERYHESTPHSAAPLLSPVAELRTPSPTHSRGFDSQEVPETNGLVKAAKIANAKQVEREAAEGRENRAPRIDSGHERRVSAPIPASNKPVQGSTFGHQQQGQGATNQSSWQQVPKKGHKKNKSTAAARTQNGSGGHSLPANEAERKGG
ncbi:Poly(A) RNA polymerase cid13 [Lecanosticta acicola]|uniref:polynucleotide adenylyltransferase n=1 Tax=Lecanosticta acicola TaxID=111012 RepID=A0AAI9EF34_9PEZI|nr:Poly(A) RNA polymerase cid13 [Lecanosticta acicola]